MAKRNWKKYLNLLSRDNKFLALGIIAVASAFFFVFGIYPHLTSVRALLSSGTTEKQLLFAESVIKEPPKPKHIETPEAVKAIYMSSWVAGTPKWRAELVDFIKKSEINSLVIDVKDYTGMVAFDTRNEKIKAEGSEEVRVKDMRESSKNCMTRIFTQSRGSLCFRIHITQKSTLTSPFRKRTELYGKIAKGFLILIPEPKNIGIILLR